MKNNRKSIGTTIVKRSTRKEHKGIHGGAWKVAFADFTLAMMALFMVLWIVSSVSEEERRLIVAQINGTSLLDGNPFVPITSPVFTDGADTVPIGGNIAGKMRRQLPRQADGELHGDELTHVTRPGPVNLMPSPQSESLNNVLQRSREEMAELVQSIMKITAIHDAQANLAIDIVPQGVRILVRDDRHREMFPRGSAILDPFFQALLLELAPVFAKIDNKILLTGHTDSTQYHGGNRYNNWNLSSERAMAARLALEQGGMPATHVLQVSGMADQMLFDEKNSQSAANRRIEIMVLTKSAADTLYQFFGNNGEKVVKQAIQRLQ